MKLARLASIVLLLAAGCAFAGPYEDGIAAYDRGDYAKSLASWLPLAEHGHRTAAFNVAVLYEKGLGTPQDYREAARWYEKAAGEGDLEAAYNVAAFYETGNGVEKNAELARKWYVAIIENPQADAAAMAVKKRARERLSKLAPDTQEIVEYPGGRLVLAGANDRCVIALQGALGGETLRKLEEVLDKAKAHDCQSPWLMLESPGGLLSEGIELGREVSDRGLRTVTRYECASACALVFLAGRERVLVGSRARIGFHQAAFVRNGTKDRHCSERWDNTTRDMQRYVFAVLPAAADNVMKLILATSCNAIEWTAGQTALDLGIATGVEADGVDVFGAKSAKH
ncbi:MAG TPA: hypothetical protein VF304_00415 [Casimicrobiaceae bacterium]